MHALNPLNLEMLQARLAQMNRDLRLMKPVMPSECMAHTRMTDGMKVICRIVDDICNENDFAPYHIKRRRSINGKNLSENTGGGEHNGHC